MSPRVPLVVGILLAGVLVFVFATTSWVSQPWGLATFIVAVLAVNLAGLALMLRMSKHQQSH